jgi:hypothetical protein
MLYSAIIKVAMTECPRYAYPVFRIYSNHFLKKADSLKVHVLAGQWFFVELGEVGLT